MEQKVTNTQVQQMVVDALDNWLFDGDTDPDGAIKRGLEFMRGCDLEEDEVAEHIKSTNDWDGLQEWADFYGQK